MTEPAPGGWLARAALLLVLGACGSSPPPPTCDVAGQAPAADLELARSACERARASYTDLFGVPAPPMRVYLSERPVVGAQFEQGWWALRWPTSATLETVGRKLDYPPTGAGQYDSLEGWLADIRDSVLPHEIGHLFLATVIGVTDLPPGSAHHGATRDYGTPLPDWFDESVAMWMEPRANRDARLARVMGAAQSPPSIAAVLATPHPSGGVAATRWRRTVTIRTNVGPCKGVCNPADDRIPKITATVDSLGRASVDTAYLDPEDGSALDAGMADTFYAPALAVMTYLRDRGGAAATTQLLKRLRQDMASRAQLAGLPGIPSDSAALQADWEAWWKSTSERLPRPRPHRVPPGQY
ncbi:MAG TPA: hypothetical protein VF584_12915 [Longimicrobium sp.]